MAEKKATPASKTTTAEAKNDRKRLNYLKTRGKELKAEMQAVKNESNALREKLGMTVKAPGGKKAGGAGGGDDE
jgi:hypothetical protein